MSTASKPRILIVDDAPEQLQLLLSFLKDDYTVIAATGGAKALELLERHPDTAVVVLDVSMPDLDGFEVCQRIRGHGTSAPDIVFLSANDSADEIMRGFDLGAADYLTKPVRPLVLKNKLGALVRRRQARSPSPPASAPATPQPATPSRSSVEGAASTSPTPVSPPPSSVPSGEDASNLETLLAGFAERCRTVHDASELGHALLDTLDGLGLQATLALHMAAGQTALLLARHEVAPLETELLQRLDQLESPVLIRGPHWLGHLPQISLLARVRTGPASAPTARLQYALTVLLTLASQQLRLLHSPADRASWASTPTVGLDAEGSARRHFQQRGIRLLHDLQGLLRQVMEQADLAEYQEQQLDDALQQGVEALIRHFESLEIPDSPPTSGISS